MKQLGYFLSSAERKVSPSEPPTENGIKKINSRTKICKFPITMKNIAAARRRWYIGELRAKLLQKTCKSFEYNGSFHEAIGSVLVIAQCFGVMPVVGVKSKSPSNLKFKWTSLRTIYSTVTVFLGLISTTFTIFEAIHAKMQFDHIIALIFAGSSVYALISFGVLARKWPRLLQQWERIEAEMPKFRCPKEKRQLSIHMNILAFIILLCSFIEHSLVVFSIYHYSNTCLHQKDPVAEIFKSQLSHILAYIPYSLWSIIVGKFVNIILTFTWNYMDLFIMMISMGLSSKFKQLNSELERIKGENMSEDYWALRRNQFHHLATFCTTVDDAISQITLLSFSNNLFFICVQLLRSIRPMVSVPHAIYFWFSLVFLISRTLAVSLYLSDINDESRKTIEVLRAVPTQSWCVEIQRFTEQVVNQTIALTGMRFFYITRKLILSVAGELNILFLKSYWGISLKYKPLPFSFTGTIITYELVLIQFHKDDEPPPSICPP